MIILIGKYKLLVGSEYSFQRLSPSVATGFKPQSLSQLAAATSASSVGYGHCLPRQHGQHGQHGTRTPLATKERRTMKVLATKAKADEDQYFVIEQSE